MRSPLIPLLLGAAFIAGAVVIRAQQQGLQRADIRDIAGLRSELDSVRAALTRAPAGAEAARLSKSIEARKYILARREFHVPSRQELIDGWWRPTGPGAVLSLVGALFLALAAFVWRRDRPRAASSSGRPGDTEDGRAT